MDVEEVKEVVSKRVTIPNGKKREAGARVAAVAPNRGLKGDANPRTKQIREEVRHLREQGYGDVAASTVAGWANDPKLLAGQKEGTRGAGRPSRRDASAMAATLTAVAEAAHGGDALDKPGLMAEMEEQAEQSAGRNGGEHRPVSRATNNRDMASIRSVTGTTKQAQNNTTARIREQYSLRNAIALCALSQIALHGRIDFLDVTSVDAHEHPLNALLFLNTDATQVCYGKGGEKSEHYYMDAIRAIDEGRNMGGKGGGGGGAGGTADGTGNNAVDLRDDSSDDDDDDDDDDDEGDEEEDVEKETKDDQNDIGIKTTRGQEKGLGCIRLKLTFTSSAGGGMAPPMCVTKLKDSELPTNENDRSENGLYFGYLEGFSSSTAAAGDMRGTMCFAAASAKQADIFQLIWDRCTYPFIKHVRRMFGWEEDDAVGAELRAFLTSDGERDGITNIIALMESGELKKAMVAVGKLNASRTAKEQANDLMELHRTIKAINTRLEHVVALAKATAKRKGPAAESALKAATKVELSREPVAISFFRLVGALKLRLESARKGKIVRALVNVGSALPQAGRPEGVKKGWTIPGVYPNDIERMLRTSEQYCKLSPAERARIRNLVPSAVALMLARGRLTHQWYIDNRVPVNPYDDTDARQGNIEERPLHQGQATLLTLEALHTGVAAAAAEEQQAADTAAEAVQQRAGARIDLRRQAKVLGGPIVELYAAADPTFDVSSVDRPGGAPWRTQDMYSALLFLGHAITAAKPTSKQAMKAALQPLLDAEKARRSVAAAALVPMGEGEPGVAGADDDDL
jgi:hypothetical protein